MKVTTQAFDAQVLALEEALRKSSRAQETYNELNNSIPNSERECKCYAVNGRYF